MLTVGFSGRKNDNCVYLQHFDDGSFIYLLLYVDDMLIVAKDPFKIIDVKSSLTLSLIRRFRCSEENFRDGNFKG